jgi:glycosyltransferase AglD
VTGVATPLPDWARHALLVTSIGAAAGIALLFLLRPEREPPEDEAGAPQRLLDRLRSGLAAVHEPLALARSVAWGLAGWGAELGIAWFTLSAVGLEPTVPLAALTVVATAAANAISVSPGNAGPFELAAMLPLAGAGVAAEPALAFALLLHVVHLAPAALLGGWVLLGEARRSAAASAPADHAATLRAGREAR